MPLVFVINKCNCPARSTQSTSSTDLVNVFLYRWRHIKIYNLITISHLPLLSFPPLVSFSLLPLYHTISTRKRSRPLPRTAVETIMGCSPLINDFKISVLSVCVLSPWIETVDRPVFYVYISLNVCSSFLFFFAYFSNSLSEHVSTFFGIDENNDWRMVILRIFEQIEKLLLFIFVIYP